MFVYIIQIGTVVVFVILLGIELVTGLLLKCDLFIYVCLVGNEYYNCDSICDNSDHD